MVLSRTGKTALQPHLPSRLILADYMGAEVDQRGDRGIKRRIPRLFRMQPHRCECFLENTLQASDLHSVAVASLAIFEHIRDVGRALLQAKVELEAQRGC